MKLKVWLGTSFVLILTLAASFALVYYFENEQDASLQALQNRVNEIELERVLERGGQRLYKQTQKMSEDIEKLISRQQTAVEKLADSKLFRQAQQDAAKRQTLLRSVKQKGWHGAWVTDARGSVIAQAGDGKAVVDQEYFNVAKTQRKTVFYAATAGQPSTLTIMVPCLSNQSNFLGVLTVSVQFSIKQIKAVTNRRVGMLLLGDQAGKLFFSTNQALQPATLEQLIGKQTKKIEDLLSKTGPKFFRARWKSKNYIVAASPLLNHQLFTFGLVPASGFEQALTVPTTNHSMLTNPVLLGGYAGIVLVGMILLLLVSGGEDLKKIIYQIEHNILGETPAQPIEVAGKGQLAKLADYINLMIDKMPSTEQSTAASEQVEEKYRETLNQAYEEIDSLRTQLEQAQQAQWTSEQRDDHSEQDQVQREELRRQLQEQIDVLEQKNQELAHSLTVAEQSVSEAKAAAEAAASTPSEPAATRDLSQEDLDMIEIIKQSGQLRTAAITNMSEDLKDTLLVIKNYISSILSSEEGKITDSQQEFLGVVINKSARLERHINDLLDISHMESEGTNWYTNPTDLVAMLQDVILNIQPQADTKQIKIVPEIQAHMPLININSDRMGQVFINLMQHALKITPFGSEVKITATETLSDIVIKVRDGGTPLTQEQSGQVFSTYHGEKSSAGIDFNGTGLRFPIIKEIIELHQGLVMMRGLPDIGNEAIVSLSKAKVMADNTSGDMGITSFSGTTMESPLPDDSSPPAMEPESSTIGEPKHADNPLAAYEVKPVEEQASASSGDDTSSGSPYDLSAFMGKLDDSQSKKPQIPSGTEDLDDLLKDIEDIDTQLDR